MKKSALLDGDDLDVFASEVARDLRVGDVVCLSGPLGAGKTTFLRVLLQALGVSDLTGFSSPTFTLLNSYSYGANTIHHADLYRLSLFSEVEELDLISSFQEPNTLSFVEWGDKFSDLETIFTVLMKFDHVSEFQNLRRISFERLRDPHVS